MKKRHIFFFFFLLIHIKGNAQNKMPQLVRDLNQSQYSGEIGNLTIFNDTLFFTSDSKEYGVELWKTDGSETNTTLVKDINLGKSGSYPKLFAEYNNKLYFGALNNGYIWETDGTKDATKQCEFIRTLETTPVSLGGYMYFISYTYTTYGLYELYKTDGTNANTTKVSNFLTTSQSAYRLFKINNLLYIFTKHLDYNTTSFKLWKYDGSNFELVKDGLPPTYWTDKTAEFNGEFYFMSRKYLWKTDGTTSGTVVFKDINPTNYYYTSSVPLYAYQNKLYFGTIMSNGGLLLNSTDGTSTNTTQLSDLSNGYEWRFAGFNNKLYYTNGSYLYSTQGTIATTKMETSQYNLYGDAIAYNNYLYFNGYSKDNSNKIGIELYKIDASGNVSLVKDIAQGGIHDIISSNPQEFKIYKNKLYFICDDNIHGKELWFTDGNTTQMVKDINAVNTKSFSLHPSNKGYVIDDNLFFIGSSKSTNMGGDRVVPQLYKYNPKTDSLKIIYNFSGEVSSNQIISNLGKKIIIKDNSFTTYISDTSHTFFTTIPNIYENVFKIFGNELYYSGVQYSGPGALYKLSSNNTITVLEGGSSVVYFYQMGNQLLFLTSNGSNLTLWKTDGTVAGTVVLKTLNGLYSTSYHHIPHIDIGNKLIFYTLDKDTYEYKLWVTDGTSTGTFVLANYGYSKPMNFGLYNGKVYFGVDSSLWVSDGTITGTMLIKTFPNGTLSNFEVYNQKLYFLQNERMWQTDGTEVNTMQKFNEQIGWFDIVKGNTTKAYIANSYYYPSYLYQCDLNLENCTHLNTKISKLSPIGNNQILALDDYGLYILKENELNAERYANYVLYSPYWKINNTFLFFADSYGSNFGTELWRYDLGCPSVLNLSSPMNNISGFGVNTTIKASNQINASNLIDRDGNGNIKVIYDAPKSILLKPGFQVSADGLTVFETKMVGCQ